MSRGLVLLAGLALVGVAACGPRAHIPPRPLVIPGALEPTDSAAILARALAPLLYIQRDEWFPLERVVAVVHPTRRVIAYHLLWRDDVHGSWVPFTVPTDEEVVWVGYDSTRAPTDIWTFWHGTVLARRLARPRPGRDRHPVGQARIASSSDDRERSAWIKKLNLFYAFTWIGLPDIWLGDLTRRGPWCFCHGYARYRDYSRLLPLADRVDVVVRAEDATDALVAVFGRPYSKKRPWPPASESALTDSLPETRKPPGV